MDSLFIDDFDKYDTVTLINNETIQVNSKGEITERRREFNITNEEKYRIGKIITFLNKNYKHKNDQIHSLITETINKHDLKSFDEKYKNEYIQFYDDLKSQIKGCKSIECLLLHIATCYGLYTNSLLMNTIAIHSRVKHLVHDKEWMDNYRLNNFLLQLTTIVYHDYDSYSDSFIKSVYYDSESKTICEEDMINKDEKITNPKTLLTFLGNKYRIFMETGKENVETDEEALKILDKLVLKYPYFTGCAHGCDVFKYKHLSPTIKDISEFIKRYPKTIVGYVLNTSTYASGNGRHWVALIFKGSEAHLFCSQGGDFSCFDDPDLVKNINSCCITTINSSVTIQTDNCNCGIYAVLANLICVLYCSGNQKMSNKHLIEHIGKDAKKLNKSGIFKIKEKLCGYNNDKYNNIIKDLLEDV